MTIHIINPTAVAEPTYTMQHNLEVTITSSIQCNSKGYIEEVRLSVIVNGGTPPYKITPSPQILATPGELIIINVTSADEQSQRLAYSIPDKCDFSNQELGSPNLNETLTPVQTEQTSLTTTPTLTQCWDGIDNDGDGFIDLQDPHCNNRTDNDEAS